MNGLNKKSDKRIERRKQVGKTFTITPKEFGRTTGLKKVKGRYCF